MSNINDLNSKEDHKSLKDDARDSRLGKLRKTNEESARKKLQEEAKTKCIDYYHNLGECAKSTGLLAGFKCNDEKWELSRCLDKYYSEEIFLQYLKDRNLPPPQPSKSLIDRINSFKLF